MAEWEAKYPVQITPTTDRIGLGFEKLRNEVPIIYSLLNRLRRLDAGAGQALTMRKHTSFALIRRSTIF